MEPKHSPRRTGLPFLACGGVFLAVAVGGQPSFLGVGLAMIGLGMIGLGMALGLRRSC